MGAGAVRSFLRLFAVQGSWNYRTMTGTGFAFALLPLLRGLHRGDREKLEEALARHVGHFNAHPYLTGMAVGAVARMEADGARPAEVDHFKTAVRGPLGSIGDRLVWSRWLPTTALAGLAIGFLSANVGVGVAVFLVLFNVLHLSLRLWSYRTGLTSGAAVAPQLRRADLGAWADRIRPLLALACGLALGGLAGPAVRTTGWLWLAVVGLAFWAGTRFGTALFRPTVIVFCAAVIGICLVGTWW